MTIAAVSSSRSAILRPAHWFSDVAMVNSNEKTNSGILSGLVVETRARHASAGAPVSAGVSKTPIFESALSPHTIVLQTNEMVGKARAFLPVGQEPACQKRAARGSLLLLHKYRAGWAWPDRRVAPFERRLPVPL